jgi:type IV pilus assembly protein PilF
MYNLGTNLGQRGLLDEAKMALKQAVALRPDDSETHNQLANVLMLQKQTDSAEEHYRMAVKHDPKNAEALYNLATLLGEQHQYSEQKEILEQFILYAPPYLERQKRWALSYLGKE